MEGLASRIDTDVDRGKAQSVVFSHHIFGSQGFGGISRYFVELAGPLRRLGVNVYTDAVWTLGASGGPFHLRSIHPVLNRRGLGWRAASLMNSVHARKQAGGYNQSKSVVYHRTYYSSGSNPARLPEVVTVYDMIHEDFPSYFKKPIIDAKIKSLRRADHIICISDYTQQRLLHYIPEVFGRTSVVYLGLSVNEVRKPYEIAPKILEQPLVAHIGKRDGYKNFAVILEALALAVRQRVQVQLKVIGAQLSNSERSRIRDLGIEDRVVECVNPASIDDALRDCLAVVSSSLAEGFGLVSLEAGLRRIPLISSEIPVMKEILGDSVLYFVPTNPEMLLSCIKTLLLGEGEYFRWANSIFKATQRYSVENMTTGTIEAYDAAIQHHVTSSRKGLK